jgi:glycosyltransferase involved in cell wall biosynthesis
MTALADVRLVCLAPDAVVPPANGSAARTVGLAAAVRPHLAGVTIHSFSPAPQPAHGLDGLDVVHIQTPTAGVARARYLAEAMLGPALGFRFPRRLDEHALVQLESPLLFEAARRAGLGRFILDAHNVYQDMAAFPQASLGDRVFYRLTRRRQARMEAACWARAAHVIFCSAVDRDRAERLLPGVAAKSSIVPNCVDVGRFTPRPPAAFARGGPVLFMGTTRYPPNFFAIQEICRDVAPALPDLEFHIVGDAVWAPAVVPPNVRFLGRVDRRAPGRRAGRHRAGPPRQRHASEAPRVLRGRPAGGLHRQGRGGHRGRGRSPPAAGRHAYRDGRGRPRTPRRRPRLRGPRRRRPGSRPGAVRLAGPGPRPARGLCRQGL